MRLITAVVIGVDSVEGSLLLAIGSLPFDRIRLGEYRWLSATSFSCLWPALHPVRHAATVAIVEGADYDGAARLERGCFGFIIAIAIVTSIS